MKLTYEDIMDVIDMEYHDEVMAAEKCKWLMKQTLNPIRKLRLYFDAKRFIGHVVGIRLVKHQIEKVIRKES